VREKVGGQTALLALLPPGSAVYADLLVSRWMIVIAEVSFQEWEISHRPLSSLYFEYKMLVLHYFTELERSGFHEQFEQCSKCTTLIIVWKKTLQKILKKKHS